MYLHLFRQKHLAAVKSLRPDGCRYIYLGKGDANNEQSNILTDGLRAFRKRSHSDHPLVGIALRLFTVYVLFTSEARVLTPLWGYASPSAELNCPVGSSAEAFGPAQLCS